MKVRTRIQVGGRSLDLEFDAENERQVFERLSFWDSLPQAGPGGEEDLKFCYRTPQGYEYYSLVCESAGMEFMFGQTKEDKSLFPKAWQKIQRGHEEGAEATAPPSLLRDVCDLLRAAGATNVGIVKQRVGEYLPAYRGKLPDELPEVALRQLHGMLTQSRVARR